MRNRIFAIIISILLIMPIGVFAEVESNLTGTSQNAIENTAKNSQESNFANQNEIQEIQTSNSKNLYKKPVSKKKIAKKFIFAMLGVAISSGLIFFILTLYNKIREKISNTPNSNDTEITLQTPENIVDAVKIFLEKNK